MDNSRFLCMHRVRVALSQVKALWRVRPGSGIPSISTMCAQVLGCCAQVIHMFVHRRWGRSPLAVLADSSGSTRRCSRAGPARRTRRSGRAWMRSPETAGTGCSPPPAGQGARIHTSPPERRILNGPDRVSSIYPIRPGYATGHAPACANRRCSPSPDQPVGTEPGSSTFRTPSIMAARDAKPATSRASPPICHDRRVSGRPESGKAPPCMRWRGLARPRHARPASCLASPVPRAARRCQTPVRGTGFPAPPTFPGSPPRWCPFPTVKAFLPPPPARAQDPAASKFRVFPPSTRYPQKAGIYPHLAVVIHRLTHSISTSNRM